MFVRASSLTCEVSNEAPFGPERTKFRFCLNHVRGSRLEPRKTEDRERHLHCHDRVSPRSGVVAARIVRHNDRIRTCFHIHRTGRLNHMTRSNIAPGTRHNPPRGENFSGRIDLPSRLFRCVRFHALPRRTRFTSQHQDLRRSRGESSGLERIRLSLEVYSADS